MSRVAHSGCLQPSQNIALCPGLVGGVCSLPSRRDFCVNCLQRTSAACGTEVSSSRSQCRQVRAPSLMCPVAYALMNVLLLSFAVALANLSWACHKLGFQVMPIVQKHLYDRQTKVRVRQLDLADPDALQSLEQLVSTEAHRVVLVWAALPHGTVSAARAKPVPQLERLNLPVPLPLRNPKRPHGLDGLRGIDKQKCRPIEALQAWMA